MKILFLHGFYASGQCVPAVALKEAFEGKAEVLTPDLPMHPKEAINFIRDLIDIEKPDALVGNSCGSFYAQMIAPIIGLPALLGNPHFKMTEFLKPRIGPHQYKSPREDGKQDFIIDEQLIAEFAELEEHQFDNYNPKYKERIWGIFGEQTGYAGTLRAIVPALLLPLVSLPRWPYTHSRRGTQFLCAADRKANARACYLIIFAFWRLSKSLQKSDASDSVKPSEDSSFRIASIS